MIVARLVLPDISPARISDPFWPSSLHFTRLNSSSGTAHQRCGEPGKTKRLYTHTIHGIDTFLNTHLADTPSVALQKFFAKATKPTKRFEAGVTQVTYKSRRFKVGFSLALPRFSCLVYLIFWLLDVLGYLLSIRGHAVVVG
jgi:hypothetical protein